MRTIIVAFVLAIASTAFAKPINVNTKARYEEYFEINCHCVGDDKAVCESIITAGPAKGNVDRYTVHAPAICTAERIAAQNLSM